MRKRLISVCIVATLTFSIYNCAGAAKDVPVDETKNIEAENTESGSEEGTDEAETKLIESILEQEEQPADILVWQEESEQEQELDFDGSNTYLSILKEYERAWEDETYTVGEWQDAAGVFMTLTDAKWLGLSTDNYTLYYSMADLTGDGAKELIIGIQDEDGIAPCFLYTDDGERIHMTDSRTGSDLVNIPTILYENGIVESTEYIKYGMYRYNFYQLPNEGGEMELIDRYFYIEDLENGTQYYNGDMENTIAEEEFCNGINIYESMPQIELDWNELSGFWEPDEDDAKTIVTGEENRRSEKEGAPEAEAESTKIGMTASKEEKEELKEDESVTVIAKEIHYDADGGLDYWYGYEYDSAGNLMRRTRYESDDSVGGWCEWKYDSAGNQMKCIFYTANGSINGWWEYGYDSVGNQVKEISYESDGSVVSWYEYGYDSAGNQGREISYDTVGGINFWYGYGYDSAGNQTKQISYDAVGNMNGWNEYEYDSTGNQTKIVRYNSDGDIGRWYEWQYDSAANLIRQAQYNADGSVYKWEEWEYDSAGNQVKWIIYYSDGSVGHCYEYEYDSEGNLTQMIDKGNNGRINTGTEYEYDLEGNMTKKIENGSSHRTESEYITFMRETANEKKDN